MTEARRKRLSTLFLVAALLTAGLLGTVDATEKVNEQGLTTGHSEFVDASSTFNSCFAGLAGALLQKVTWFNGATLFSRMEGGGTKWVYVTEHLEDDAPKDGFNESTGFRVGVDPSEQQLFRTNQTYKFNDENEPEKEWVVREYFMLRDKKKKAVDVDEPVDEDETATTKEKFYVFTVKVAQDSIEDPTLGKDYNFAMVIDTCRFKTNGTTTQHDNGVNGTTGQPRGQHDDDNQDGETHPHGEFSVDIWVGNEPKTLPGDPQVPDDRGNESTEDDAKDGKP